jgi:predicted CopG family antitoxin
MEIGGYRLPRKGYRTICVTDEVYHYIQKKAEETDRTMPEYIKHLIEKENIKKGEN